MNTCILSKVSTSFQTTEPIVPKPRQQVPKDSALNLVHRSRQYLNMNPSMVRKKEYQSTSSRDGLTTSVSKVGSS